MKPIQEKQTGYCKATGLLSNSSDHYSMPSIRTIRDTTYLRDLIEELVPKHYRGYVEIEISIRELDITDSYSSPLKLPPEPEEEEEPEEATENAA